MTENKKVEWHQRFNGHELRKLQEFHDGQGSLECYSSWGQKESDTTERLN